ncbi:MAG TPA: hypothetical protein VM658_21385 [bacterium]|nr:hypothetical protein [bacterium]
MAGASFDEGKFKELLKEAVFEALRENRDLIYDVVAEVMEDAALAKAIQEGEPTGTVSREEVFKVL